MKKNSTAHTKSRTSTVRSATNHTPASRQLASRLQQNVLFKGVSPRKVSALRPKMTIQRFGPGEIIFDESTEGRELYLLVEGVVRIKKITRHGLESVLAVLHEGDFFGELSLIDQLPRSARAEAVRSCTIARLKADDFRALTQRDIIFARNVLQNLTRRLRTMDQTFIRELDRHSLSAAGKMGKLNLLIEASKIVNSTIELDKLLVIILDAASRSINADRGTLYLIDETTNALWSKVMQGRNMVEIRLPIGKGLAGYVAKTGETVNIADAYKDPRFNPEIDRKTGYVTHNVLCMPMRDKKQKIVGVFQFLNKKGGAFSEEDESFIDAFSVHAAIAIENAHLAQEMINSERLSAVGRMASTIIHDIKNPMSTLRMYAQAFKSKLGDAEGAQMADDMVQQVDRFVNMTQEILDFSRGISETHLETASLAKVMDAALRFIESDMNKKRVILVRDLRYVGEVNMDVEKMQRVFYNLAGNAADAMPHGGILTVATEARNGDLLISFSDTGMGIPEEIRSRVFEPFFTHGKKHGTGLGLAIIRKIIDEHKGGIEITSEVGRGTTITVRLPRHN